MFLLGTRSILATFVPVECSEISPRHDPSLTQKPSGMLSPQLKGDLGERPEIEVKSLMQHH